MIFKYKELKEDSTDWNLIIFFSFCRKIMELVLSSLCQGWKLSGGRVISQRYRFFFGIFSPCWGLNYFFRFILHWLGVGGCLTEFPLIYFIALLVFTQTLPQLVFPPNWKVLFVFLRFKYWELQVDEKDLDDYQLVLQLEC